MKYSPLKDHLIRLDQKGHAIWESNFKKIEHILDTDLPISATRLPEWWANEDISHTRKSQCRSWGEAGWKTIDLNIQKQTITFIKKPMADDLLSRKHSTTKSLALQYSWIAIGNIFIDHKERLQFPTVNEQPTIYKLACLLEGKKSLYIGETNNFQRRLQGYRTPGPTQPTNKRLQNLIVEALNTGATAKLYCMENHKIKSASSGQMAISLTDKNTRLLFEGAAIAHYRDLGTSMLNLF